MALLGIKWQAALILGFGFALSSTAFVMQLLGERGEMATKYGQASFAILIMQDLAIVPAAGAGAAVVGSPRPGAGTPSLV